MKSKIKTEVHTHTLASSHAYNTMQEMLTDAAQKGIELLAITNHGPALNGDGVHFWHFANMGLLPRKINGIYLIRGAETNLIDFNN